MIQLATSLPMISAGPARPVLLAAQSGTSNFALALSSLLAPATAPKAAPGETQPAESPVAAWQIAAEPGKDLPEIALDLSEEGEAPEQDRQADDDAPASEDLPFAWFAVPVGPTPDAATVAPPVVAARAPVAEQPPAEVPLPEIALGALTPPLRAAKTTQPAVEGAAAPVTANIEPKTAREIAPTQMPSTPASLSSPRSGLPPRRAERPIAIVPRPDLVSAAPEAPAAPTAVPVPAAQTAAVPVTSLAVATPPPEAGAAITAAVPEAAEAAPAPAPAPASASLTVPAAAPILVPIAVPVAASPPVVPETLAAAATVQPDARVTPPPAFAGLAAAPVVSEPGLQVTEPPAPLIDPVTPPVADLLAARSTVPLRPVMAPAPVTVAPVVAPAAVPIAAAPLASPGTEAPSVTAPPAIGPVQQTIAAIAPAPAQPATRIDAPAPQVAVEAAPAPLTVPERTSISTAQPSRPPAVAAAQPMTVASLIAQASAQPAAAQPIAFAPLRRAAGEPEPLVTTIAAPGVAMLQQVAATPDAQQGALDMRRQEWMGKMVETIEAMREAAPVKETRISLVPDALGKVDIAVRQDGDRVHVHFNAETQAARQILTDAQPRLAELAEARGIRLGQTSVESQGGGAQSGQRHSDAPRPNTPSAPASARGPKDQFAHTDDDRVA